jgi:alpha-L-fucosidase
LLCYRVAVKSLSVASIALVLCSTVVAQSKPPQNYSANVARQVAKVHREVAPAKDSLFRPNWESLARYRTPDWFRDAKFGIFLHWGVYSVPAFGSEWYSRNMYVPGSKEFEHQVAKYGSQTTFGYKDFVPMFKGQKFDANAWVDLFVRAGARYVVPVGEHCDGFAMYDSEMTPWNAVRMGPHRDVVGELGAAARARGLRFGVSSHTAEHWWWYGRGRSFPSDVRDMNPYTALMYGPAEPMNLPGLDGTTNDAKEPNPNHLEDWVAPDRRFLDNWLALSSEIVDKYHPDLIYFDWWIGQPAFQPALQQFAAYYYDGALKRHQQPVLTYKDEAMPANVATLDIERGKLDTLRWLPWQTDTSVSIKSWGYVENDQYRTAKSLIDQLVDTVSKNGNLLLNVGPEADGTIPEQARTVLLQMGEWLRINGDAIYNTRPFVVYGEGPTKATGDSTQMNHDIQVYTAQDIRYTTSKSGSILYATALGWPRDATLILRTLYTDNSYLPSPVCSVKLMGTGQDILFRQQPDGLHLSLPITPPKSLPKNIAYVFAVATHCQEAMHS